MGIVGDFDPEGLVELVAQMFGDWSSNEPYQRLGQTRFDVVAQSETIDTPDKQMAIVARGASFALRDDDPDYAALLFANFVFGQSPNSRLMNALRHDGGLSYGAGSILQVDDEEEVAEILGYAICAPENAREAQSVMQAQFSAWFEEGLTGEEFEEWVNGYLEQHKTQLGDDDYVVQQMLRDLRTGRDFGYRQRRVDVAKTLDQESILAAISRIPAGGFVDLIGGDVSKCDGE